MQSEFQRLFDTNYKPVNIRTLSNDSAIQLHGRKRGFLTEYDESTGRIVYINEDLINTEANLKPDVLRKILFQLELDCSIIDPYESDIHRLVNIRNSFAHGERGRYPSESEYFKYREAAFNTMRNIKNLIETAFSNQAYLRAI